MSLKPLAALAELGGAGGGHGPPKFSIDPIHFK